MATLSAMKSLFRNKNFAIYICSNAISLIGFWIQRLAISWLTWELTESAFWVGAVAFAELAPLLVVSPIVGVWADRLNRKVMTVITQAAMMLQSFTLFILIASDLINIKILFAFALLDGILQAADQPIKFSIVPNLVVRKDIVSASSLSAVVFNAGRLLGPALAGLIISSYGAAIAVLCNALSTIPILCSWFFINLLENSSQRDSSSTRNGLNEGVNYIKSLPAVSYLFLLQSFITGGIRPVTLMLAAFIGAVYKGGVDGLAIYSAALGLGAVGAGLYISLRGKAQGLVSTMLVNSMVAVFALMLFAISTQFYFGLVFIFVLGWGVTTSTVASMTMLQNSIDDRFRGRVLSLWIAVTRGATAFGVLLIGLFADIYGLLLPFLVSASICFVVLILFWKKQNLMQAYFES